MSAEPADGASAAAAPPAARAAVPADKVNLRLLLVSSQRSEILVDAAETFESIRRRVFDAWPAEWQAGEASARPADVAQLRFVWRGKFLELGSTPASLQIPTGDTTVVHLLIKQVPQAASSQGKSKSQPASPLDGEPPRQGCLSRCLIL